MFQYTIVIIGFYSVTINEVRDVFAVKFFYNANDNSFIDV